MTHVVDAHALVWFVERNPRLGASARAVLESPQSVLLIPAIALAEACWTVASRRTAIPSVEALYHAAIQDVRARVDPIDADIVRRCHTSVLQVIPEMHDRQIVAAALRLAESGEPVALLTQDAQIVASGLVTIIW